MAQTDMTGNINIYYSIHKDLPSTRIIETYSKTDNIYTIYLSDIAEIFGELPPHMTFLGWYYPELNQTFMQEIKISASSLPDLIELQAKWDINTSFKFKGVSLFDFSAGGINVSAENLIEGTIAYDAKGFPIKGTMLRVEGVNF